MQEVKNLKCVCIPVERYEKMVESYDKAVEELAELKEQLKEVGKRVRNVDLYECNETMQILGKQNYIDIVTPESMEQLQDVKAAHTKNGHLDVDLMLIDAFMLGYLTVKEKGADNGADKRRQGVITWLK